jgi:hypothetical protein
VLRLENGADLPAIVATGIYLPDPDKQRSENTGFGESRNVI